MVYQYWLNYLEIHDTQLAEKVISSEYGNVLWKWLFKSRKTQTTSYTYGNYVDSNKLNIIHNDFHAKSWQGRYAKEFQF